MHGSNAAPVGVHNALHAVVDAALPLQLGFFWLPRIRNDCKADGFTT